MQIEPPEKEILMNATLLKPSDASWCAVLEELQHDIYHTPEYVAHAAAHAGSDPVGVVVRSQAGLLFVPLLVRPLPNSYGASGERDATSPYGYPGPIFSANATAAAKYALWDGFRAILAEHRVITAFIRWHPLFPPPTLATVSDAETQASGQTVSIDLTLSDEEFAGELRSGHRYEIRRLERLGFAVAMNDWTYWDGFIELYKETMQRVSATDSYHFSHQWFHQFRAALGDQLHLGVVTSPTGELASASLFTERCGVLQYHLSATASGYLRLSPAKLLLARVRDWAKDRGNHTFHLGGGVGGGSDSLFRFKSGFSKQCHSFFLSRMVIDRQRYQVLAPGQSTVPKEPASPAARFFPAYRSAA